MRRFAARRHHSNGRQYAQRASSGMHRWRQRQSKQDTYSDVRRASVMDLMGQVRSEFRWNGGWMNFGKILRWRRHSGILMETERSLCRIPLLYDVYFFILPRSPLPKGRSRHNAGRLRNKAMPPMNVFTRRTLVLEIWPKQAVHLLRRHPPYYPASLFRI